MTQSVIVISPSSMKNLKTLKLTRIKFEYLNCYHAIMVLLLRLSPLGNRIKK